MLDNDCLVGNILQDKYLIGEFLDKGSHGRVHKITDMTNPKTPLVIKIASNTPQFTEEIKIMKIVNKDVESLGKFCQNGNLMAWVIMPRYGSNLENCFKKIGSKFSKGCIYEIGTAVLTHLEAVHRAGYVFNDLKLENLMVDYVE
jgi:serine/threonine protein kinase